MKPKKPVSTAAAGWTIKKPAEQSKTQNPAGVNTPYTPADKTSNTAKPNTTGASTTGANTADPRDIAAGDTASKNAETHRIETGRTKTGRTETGSAATDSAATSSFAIDSADAASANTGGATAASVEVASGTVSNGDTGFIAEAGQKSKGAANPPTAKTITEQPVGLALLSVFGGLYLLYTWGWFVVAGAYAAENQVASAGSGSIGGFLQQVLFWAATLAPVLWFYALITLRVRARLAELVVWLIVGAVLFLPYPMLIARVV